MRSALDRARGVVFRTRQLLDLDAGQPRETRDQLLRQCERWMVFARPLHELRAVRQHSDGLGHLDPRIGDVLQTKRTSRPTGAALCPDSLAPRFVALRDRAAQRCGGVRRIGLERSDPVTVRARETVDPCATSIVAPGQPCPLGRDQRSALCRNASESDLEGRRDFDVEGGQAGISADEPLGGRGTVGAIEAGACASRRGCEGGSRCSNEVGEHHGELPGVSAETRKEIARRLGRIERLRVGATGFEPASTCTPSGETTIATLAIPSQALAITGGRASS